MIYERSETCIECTISLLRLVSKVMTARADYTFCCYSGSSVDEFKTTPNAYIACLQRLHNGILEAMLSDDV